MHTCAHGHTCLHVMTTVLGTGPDLLPSESSGHCVVHTDSTPIQSADVTASLPINSVSKAKDTVV